MKGSSKKNFLLIIHTSWYRMEIEYSLSVLNICFSLWNSSITMVVSYWPLLTKNIGLNHGPKISENQFIRINHQLTCFQQIPFINLKSLALLEICSKNFHHLWSTTPVNKFVNKIGPFCAKMTHPTVHCSMQPCYSFCVHFNSWTKSLFLLILNVDIQEYKGRYSLSVPYLCFMYNK